MNEEQLFTVIVSEIQLAQQLCMKSMQKNLFGFEILLYEQLCRFNAEYVEQLRGTLEKESNERSRETKGGSSQSGT